MKVLSIAVILCGCAALQAASLFPNLHELRVDVGDRSANIWNKTACRAVVFSEPDQTLVRTLAIAAEGEALAINTEKAFQAGASGIICNFLGIGADGLQPGEKELTVCVEGPKGAKMKIFFEGYTLKDQHYARGQEVELSGERQILTFKQSMEEPMKSLHLRFDLKQGGLFKFYAVDCDWK